MSKLHQQCFKVLKLREAIGFKGKNANCVRCTECFVCKKIVFYLMYDVLKKQFTFLKESSG